MKRSLFTVVVLLLLAVPSIALAANLDEDALGGTLAFSGQFGLSSPCVSEQLNTNGVKVSVSLLADVDRHRENVDIRVSFKGNASGDQGGVYTILNSAHASYSVINTVGLTYTLPVKLDVDGVGATPSFTWLFDLVVAVDANTQNPNRAFFGGGGASCDLK